MNSSSARERSRTETERKGANKGKEAFINADSTARVAKMFARSDKPGAKSYADIVSGKGTPPATAKSTVVSAAAKQTGYADAVKAPAGSAAKREKSVTGPKADLLGVGVDAAAAFQALASVRSQEELDISAIAANDTTIPLVKGKGGADGKEGDSDDKSEEADGSQVSREKSPARDEDEDCEGASDNGEGASDNGGNDGDFDEGDAGQEAVGDGETGFRWTKQARRAEEKRQQEEAAARIAAKAEKKLRGLEERMRQEKANAREAAALRKRSRTITARQPPQDQPPPQQLHASKGKSPALPPFVPQTRTTSKEQRAAARKAAKRARTEPKGDEPQADKPGGEHTGETSQAASDEPGKEDEPGREDAPPSSGGEDDEAEERAGKRRCPNEEGIIHRGTRALGRSVNKAKGRAAAAEFERHKLKTKRREKGRESARGLVKAALHQLRRQSKGEQLDSNEQQLATYAANLSPAKILGAGIRIGTTASSGDGSGSEEGLDLLEATRDGDESVDELVEELGCTPAEARDALNRSCRWTANGNSSRIKAANWLKRELEEADAAFRSAKRQREPGHPGTQSAARATRPSPAGASTDRGRGGSGGGSTAVPARGDENSRNPKTNRNRVPTGRSGSHAADAGEFPSSSSDYSSESSSKGSSEDSSDSSSEAKERTRQGGSFLPRNRSQTATTDRHKTRYLRNLGKVLLIDDAQAQAVYEATRATIPRMSQPSWGSLLHTFYQQEVDKAKGTQEDHARSLELGAPAPPGPSPSPTFSLPDWSSGQPPQGGLHFSTLNVMLEAYEKFERQTNYQTSVTFKSMIKAGLRPSFESKCGLPRTVWKNPKATDAVRVRDGLKEEGGWSDLRFLAAVRRTLAPIGRTSYEIAFEKLKLYHRGTDSQLAVTLSIWGEKWLAKEREAEEQAKTLPFAKMKILFKSAVSSVPKFKRWLEGKTFISSSDWFQYLSRKLHRSLSKSQEEEHDNRDTRQDRGWDSRGGTEPWRGGSSRGGGDARGDNGTSRGGGPAGESYRPQRGASQSYRGHSGGSRVDPGQDAQGLSSYRFSAPPGRANHMSGGRGYDDCTHDDWRHEQEQGFDEHHHEEHYDEDGYENGRFNGMSAHGHSGGAEPMVYSPGQARGRGGFRGGRGGGEARSPRKPVNDPSEDTAERLSKGVRWHDSAKAGSQCRDPDCGTRQDVPFCQGCGMHGHDRPFCFKCREAAYNATGYWDKNRPNQPAIQGLKGIRREDATAATARGNIMDATQGVPGPY